MEAEGMEDDDPIDSRTALFPPFGTVIILSFVLHN